MSTLRKGSFESTWDIFENDRKVGTMREGTFDRTWDIFDMNESKTSTHTPDAFDNYSWRLTEGTFVDTYDVSDIYGNDYSFFDD